MFCYSFVTQTVGASLKDYYFHKKKRVYHFDGAEKVPSPSLLELGG